MIRILLIDDHTLFRSGVKALLQRQPDFEVVGEASDGLEGVKLVEQVEADVVLLDLDMPSMNGREALEQIRETHPNLAVLMLTVSEDCEALGECLKLGARGYLLKKIDQDFLLRSIRAAYNGDSVISPANDDKVCQPSVGAAGSCSHSSGTRDGSDRFDSSGTADFGLACSRSFQ